MAGPASYNQDMRNNFKALAALIFGIASIVGFFTDNFGIGVASGIASLALGYIAQRDPRTNKTLAKVGTAFGCYGLLFLIVIPIGFLIILFVWALASSRGIIS